MKFPCTQCAACCRTMGNMIKSRESHPDQIKQLIDEFPYKTVDGVCEKLEGNDCTVYENRPTICNIKQVHKLVYSQEINKRDFFRMNSVICNGLQERLQIAEDFRIKL